MYLAKYIAKRLFWGAITLLIILFITFWLVRMLKIEPPIDKTMRAIQEARREMLGYNKPIPVQFWNWISALLKGNWGTSYFLEKGEPVLGIIGRRLIPTLVVNSYSEIVIIPLGILLGIFSAIKKNKWQDYAISTGSMVFMTLPTFVWCFFWMYTICFLWPIFPLQASSLNDAGGWFTWKMFHSMVPAVLALSLPGVASLARSIRAELADQIETDYMLLARAKGLTYRQAIYKHSLKNAFVPIFPGIIAGFLGLLGGSMIIETIFGIPGIGRVTIQSMRMLDYELYMGCITFYGVITVFSYIIYDISFSIIDPRIKMGAR